MQKWSRFIPIVYLVLLSVYIVMGTHTVPFHGDESTQIYMGRDYYVQFIQGDVGALAYSSTPQYPADQELRLYNGSLPKYIFGFISTNMGYTLDTWAGSYDWGAPYDYNVREGHIPDPENLYQTRLGSVIGLVIGLWALFALGNALGGHGVAYLVSFYYAVHPVILLNGRRAMMEGYLTGFSILVVLFAVWVLQRYVQRYAKFMPYTRTDWVLYAGLGIMSGLCLASKHTGLFILVAVFFALGSVGFWHFLFSKKSIHQKRITQYHIRATFVAGILGLVVFYVLNPVWWGGNALFLSKLIYDLRSDLLNVQVQIFGGYADFWAKLRGFLDFSFVATPQYYEVSDWQIHIADQITLYETTVWRGISIGGSLVGAIVFGGFVLWGIVALIRNKHQQAAKWVLLWWGLAMFALSLLLTPLEWQRYYLPIYPVIGLLGACGIADSVRLGISKWQKPNPSPTPPHSP
jgi:hypothetical protein